MFIIIVFCQDGVVDGLLVYVSYVIPPLLLGVAARGDGASELCLVSRDFSFFRTRFTFLWRELMGKYLCLSSTFAIAILNSTCFFPTA